MANGFWEAFTVKELTFAGLFLSLFALTVVPFFRGGLMTLRHHSEVVDILLKRIEDEKKIGEDWKKTATELLVQNTLLLRKDDVATTAISSIHEFLQKHEEEDQT